MHELESAEELNDWFLRNYHPIHLPLTFFYISASLAFADILLGIVVVPFSLVQVCIFVFVKFLAPKGAHEVHKLSVNLSVNLSALYSKTLLKGSQERKRGQKKESF